MRIHVHIESVRHDYYVALDGSITPPFAPTGKEEEIHLLLEKGIINPSPAQRDRITEIEAAVMPSPIFHFAADE